MGSDAPETVAAIVAAHRAATMTPAQTVARSYQRIRAYNDPAVFISLRDEKEALADAQALTSKDAAALPLSGVPVAIKANIDPQGMPTTAACPAFSYSPAQDSTAVAKLRAAGAIVIGKTNLDQFATGLVGVRSPYGIPVNPIRADLIPGGSSSGSAVAVSAGLVPLALGTDTAGSGRVPAMLNNIVGLKPSLGLISNAGLVPACRTLDCISVFSLTVDDAMAALAAMAGPDGADPFSRDRPLGQVAAFPGQLRLGVPRNGQLIFFGDLASATSHGYALRRIAERTFGNIDALVLPTAPTAYSTAQVLANPVELNSRLGTYTNFVNLLDLCGLALPAAMRPDGIPFGITLLAPAGHDAQLASIGRVFHADTGLKMGSRPLPLPPLALLPTTMGG